jgi:hypothetical protein
MNGYGNIMSKNVGYDEDEIDLGNIEELDFEGIEGPRARMITFGEQFEKWTDKHKIEYLKKFSSSMNHAADIMQQERNKILVEKAGLVEQVSNLEGNLTIQKTIVLKAITDNNTAKDDYIRLIQELEGKLRASNKVVSVLQDKLSAHE